MTHSNISQPRFRFGSALLAVGSLVFVAGTVMFAMLKSEWVGYMLGLFVGWQLNGPMLIAGGLCLGALGVQIVRKES